MKAIGIITDSHSSIDQKKAEELGIMVLPMPFSIGGKCYYEGVTLSREEFFQKLDSGEDITTSQPSPEEVMELWDRALKEYETVLYLPISSGLSGSCETAEILVREEAYENRVFVVDNGRVSTPMHRAVLDALELIEEGYTAAQIKEILEKNKQDMVIYIAVETLEHLKRGGRITPAAAALGTVLNVKPVLKLDVGNLDVFKKCRGFAKAKKTMIMAAASTTEEELKAWVKEIEEAFPGMPVLSDYLSMGVSCHIGYGGLGIGCACRPKRMERE